MKYVIIGLVVAAIITLAAYWQPINNWLFLRLYGKDIVTLYKSFIDSKYPTTGIAQTKDNLVQFARLHGWSVRRFNKVFNYCVRMDIIQDHPNNPRRHGNSKQFFYILNPEYLQ